MVKLFLSVSPYLSLISCVSSFLPPSTLLDYFRVYIVVVILFRFNKLVESGRLKA